MRVFIIPNEKERTSHSFRSRSVCPASINISSNLSGEISPEASRKHCPTLIPLSSCPAISPILTGNNNGSFPDIHTKEEIKNGLPVCHLLWNKNIIPFLIEALLVLFRVAICFVEQKVESLEKKMVVELADFFILHLEEV